VAVAQQAARDEKYYFKTRQRPSFEHTLHTPGGRGSGIHTYPGQDGGAIYHDIIHGNNKYPRGELSVPQQINVVATSHKTLLASNFVATTSSVRE
jgi:hypothetical protein